MRNANTRAAGSCVASVATAALIAIATVMVAQMATADAAALAGAQALANSGTTSAPSTVASKHGLQWCHRQAAADGLP